MKKTKPNLKAIVMMIIGAGLVARDALKPKLPETVIEASKEVGTGLAGTLLALFGIILFFWGLILLSKGNNNIDL